MARPCLAALLTNKNWLTSLAGREITPNEDQVERRWIDSDAAPGALDVQKPSIYIYIFIVLSFSFLDIYIFSFPFLPLPVGGKKKKEEDPNRERESRATVNGIELVSEDNTIDFVERRLRGTTSTTPLGNLCDVARVVSDSRLLPIPTDDASRCQ